MNITLKDHQGRIENVTAQEITTILDGKDTGTRVFELTKEDGTSLGEIIFHLEDHYEWIYDGSMLTDYQQDQISIQLQSQWLTD